MSVQEKTSGSDKLAFIEAHLQENKYMPFSEDIEGLLKDRGYIPLPIKDVDVDAIYRAFKDGVVDESVDVRRDNVYHHYALAMLFAGNTELAIKYFETAIEQGNDMSMFSLGFYYIELKEYDMADKYFSMAAEIKNCYTMHKLALCLECISKRVKAEEYYLQAIEYGCMAAIYDLGEFYECEGKDSLAEKYYLMGVAKGDADCMYGLGLMYRKRKKDWEAAEKYYKMALNNDTKLKRYKPERVFNGLETFYSRRNKYEDLFALYMAYQELVDSREDILKCIQNMFSTQPSSATLELFCEFEFQDDDAIPTIYRLFQTLLKQDLDLMELHMKYRPESEGFTQAKEDFFNQLTQ
jgi:tetratricopeptide (TPR) repeat protein